MATPRRGTRDRLSIRHVFLELGVQPAVTRRGVGAACTVRTMVRPLTEASRDVGCGPTELFGDHGTTGAKRPAGRLSPNGIRFAICSKSIGSGIRH
jgi:hypothetical protein